VTATGHRWVIDVAVARESWREGVTASAVAPVTASRRHGGADALSQRSGTVQAQLVLRRRNFLVIDQMDSVHVKYRVDGAGHSV